MAGHRRNGEGSIYQRSTDKRWIGAVTLGYDANGKQRRKVVSAKTRAEVFKSSKHSSARLMTDYQPPTPPSQFLSS